MKDFRVMSYNNGETKSSTNSLVGLILLFTTIFSGCQFVNDMNDIRKSMYTHILDSYCMEPLNKFEAEYEVDFDAKVPKRFDIVQFTYEDEYFDSKDFYSDSEHASRVIGLPSETIEMKKGYVYINDKLLHEPFIQDSLRSNESMDKLQLADNEYFVMVDKRKMIFQDTVIDEAHKPYDSRKIGVIYKWSIRGTTTLKKR